MVRESFTDSVLFVLHDWSCAISCEQDALDAERGVISEEWRRKDEPRALMADLQNRLVYKGAKHTERNVLGTLEIINGFTRDEILDFYHKWYRPDLQAIAIVGDIDVEDMEERIKKIFSDIPAQENPAPKVEYTVPAQDGPLFVNMLHPMISFNTLKVIHKHPYTAVGDRKDMKLYRDRAFRMVATEIVKERFARETEKEDCPAKNVAVVSSEVSDDFYMTLFTISPKNDSLQEEVLAMYARELKRLMDHGFSADELQAAKFQAVKRLRINPSETVKNREWINSCKEHFLRGEALLSPAAKKELQSMAIDEASAEDISACLREMFVDSGKIYSYTIEEEKKDILPSEARMRAILADVEAETLEAVYPDFRKLNLDIAPSAGSVTKVSDGPSEGSETWMLSNGIKVVRMSSEPVRSSQHLVLKAVFDTGFKALPQDRMESARAAAAYAERNFGTRGYSRKELRDSPMTGNISMTAEIGRDESSITVTCGKEDAGNAFRLLHLVLTEPYFDTEKNLGRFRSGQIKSLAKGASERTEFDRESRRMRYGDHPWRQEITKKDYEAVDMELVREVFARSFSDFKGMKVYICDDLAADDAREWCCRYIASLDGEYGYEKGRQLASWPQYAEKQSLVKENPLKTVPKSEVKLSFRYGMKLRSEEFAIFDILDYIMNARCMNRIREERGGTYSVTFRTEMFPQGKTAESSIEFQTRPEMARMLVDDARELVEAMAEEGPSEAELENAKKYLAKRHQEMNVREQESLSRKLERLMMKDRYGIDRREGYTEALVKASGKDVMKMARRMKKGGSILAVYTEK